jgi:peptidoglycan/xylan/chitin deacetylase (PgdA/CDA1 family)
MRRRPLIPIVLVLAVAMLAAGSCGRHRPSNTGSPPSASASASAGATAEPTPTTGPTSPSPTRSQAVPTPPGPPPTPTQAGPPSIPGSLLGREITYIPTTRKVVALTFDAGANANGLPSILGTLSAQGVRATFFLTGDFAVDFPASVRAIVAGGHRLANHTATHPYCTQLTDAQIKAQVALAESQIRAAGGTSTKPLFRFPYGDRNSRTIAAVNSVGYVPIGWTVDSWGWRGSRYISVSGVVTRVVAAARTGEIVLMHVGSNPDDHTTYDAQALPTIIAQLRAKGYGFVTLDALLS